MGLITSITFLNKNYLAVNNLNDSIHIFDIYNKNNNNISYLIGSYFYGNYISSFMEIKYNCLIKENEGEFYEADFQKKRAILTSEDDDIELRIIAYNGFAYKLRINFLKKYFDIISKEKFAEYKMNQNDEDFTNESEVNLYNSYVSIFDKDKKMDNEKKFIVYK